MDAVVKEEENMIEPKEEVEDTVEWIKPKIELIDEMDAKKEEIDDTEYQNVVPYEYRDYNEQHTEQERPKWHPRKPTKKLSCQCQKCNRVIVLRSFTDAQKHAATHTYLKKFKCDQCNYGYWIRSNVQKHIDSKHKNKSCSVKEIQLSEEQQLELRRLARECFPGMDENSRKILTINGKPFNSDETPFEETPTNARKLANKCQKCNKFVLLGWFSDATSHAVTHTNLKRFICEKCDYGSWYRANVQSHINYRHKNESCSAKEIHLAEEVQLELRKIAEECFPEVIKALKRKTTVNEKSVKVEEEHSTISRKRQRTSDAD